MTATPTAAVLTRHTWRSAFRATGSDHREHLHRMLSCRMLECAPGERVHGLLLDNKGRVLADLDLWVLENEVIGLADSPAIPRVVSVLERTILRSDVAIADLGDTHDLFRLEGPTDAEVAAGPHGVRRLEIAGVPVLAARGGVLPGVDVLVAAERAEAVGESLRASCSTSDGDRPAWERRRIELGVVAIGNELTGAELPQEARLDDALDFAKGCYPGQETVARLHYRGHVNRLLYRLDAEAPLIPGPITDGDGRVVGSLTSAVGKDQGSIALGYLRAETVAAGVALVAAGGIGVRASEAPWARLNDAQPAPEPRTPATKAADD